MIAPIGPSEAAMGGGRKTACALQRATRLQDMVKTIAKIGNSQGMLLDADPALARALAPDGVARATPRRAGHERVARRSIDPSR
jgi:hypothetical protein